ncbi:CIA30 family protein [Tropicimonas sediminicola]|uniref:Complex I intermediate-associated protein 30 (CIA30) n=1 Tax=Tropicimonas sediminicola TaxID=1031541 RepID=A0A239LB81_9RHOB|nr:CIA30 family protein [Tropicimonas sediminicola]SNT27896.1 Complex I intermediate-associated protein 30 (CIA30) [Tropicimonas sediminicola]
MREAAEVIDDLRAEPPVAAVGTRWSLVSDRVMGGVSSGAMSRERIAGRDAIRLQGAVSLENNGGFLQLALDLASDGEAVDARRWTGLRLDVFGNDQDYNLHLRTSDIRRPWESFRHAFRATPDWTTVLLPFAEFTPHRTDQPLRLERLRRIGVVAIGRAFEADVAIADIRFYGGGRPEA